MRKPVANLLPVTIRFKEAADNVMASEIELLMSVLPQLIAAMSAEAQMNSEPIPVEKLSLQQKDNLTLDNYPKQAEDIL